VPASVHGGRNVACSGCASWDEPVIRAMDNGSWRYRKLASPGRSGDRCRGGLFPSCHDRFGPDHPRLCLDRRKKSWVAGLNPAMTQGRKPSPDCPAGEPVLVFRAARDRTRLYWEETVAKQFERIEAAQAAFISQQHMFFTATAAATGRVNISPREAGAFRLLDPNTVAYVDQTGSGIETAAHLRLTGRPMIMFRGFENGVMTDAPATAD
jgi:hypothetical protein